MFGTVLTQSQVDGLNVLLDVWAKWYAPKYPAIFLAAILNNIYRETGGRMQPVLETYATSRKSAATRLEAAFKAGKLKWVKTRYWLPDESGQIGVGGGHIQLTHRANYVKAQKKLAELFGVDIPLGSNYDLILNPVVSAHVAMSGMIHGWFTGEDLYDHLTPAKKIDWVDSRSIVNGDERHIAKELKTAGEAFWAALQAAGADRDFGPPETVLYFPGQKVEKNDPVVTKPTSNKRTSLVDIIIAIFRAIFGGRNGTG